MLAKPRRIRARPLRQWFGLSQAQFARATGTSRPTVQRWEARGIGPEPNSAEGRLVSAIADLKRTALRVFGPRHGRAWFHDPAPTFGGKTPLEVLIERGPIPVRDDLKAADEGGY
ncbi:MAG: helix-turn-helix domain-containing protein [bacterium]